MNANRLKQERKNKKLTQVQLGKLVGVSGAYIQQLEKQIKTNPSIQLISKIAEALGISQSDLLEVPSDTSYQLLEAVLEALTMDRLYHTRGAEQIHDLTAISLDTLQAVSRHQSTFSQEEQQKLLKVLEYHNYDQYVEFCRQYQKLSFLESTPTYSPADMKVILTKHIESELQSTGTPYSPSQVTTLANNTLKYLEAQLLAITFDDAEMLDELNLPDWDL